MREPGHEDHGHGGHDHGAHERMSLVQLETSGASCPAENHHVEHLLAEARPAR